MLKFLCSGPLWRGSNAGGLFKAISSHGHMIQVVDEFYYIPLKTKAFLNKVSAFLLRGSFIKDYNNEVIELSDIYNPDIILIYKGAFIMPETLQYLRKKNKFLVNFFPDVSFHTHGQYLIKSIPLYDLIFTTKTFGINDLKVQFNMENVHFIPHGFDPDIHRPINQEDFNKWYNSCDVSFIGTWSPKKEDYLKQIITNLPDLDIKIFGGQWFKAAKFIRTKWAAREVLGDYYALNINKSKINLGLLSEKIVGASSGDKITSRTFHIPASGGFLLHEYTDEVSRYFIEDKEIACFKNTDELVQKIEYFLKNETEREKIGLAGYKRALKDHSLHNRTTEMLKVINEYMLKR